IACASRFPRKAYYSKVLYHLKASNLSYLFSITNHQMDKRKCNTATCATQRLANFLVRSSHNLGAVLSTTNVGSNTYGKRNAAEVLNREPLNYLRL
uniref:Islet amyloid polypeptide n=1 Tax=Spermophilus dauricus TaxID=99837 RepID=A0A8C9PA93_SPEDA